MSLLLVRSAMTSPMKSAAMFLPPSPSMLTRRTAPLPPARSAPPPPDRSARTSRRTWPGRPSRRGATLSTLRSAPSLAAMDTITTELLILWLHDLMIEITDSQSNLFAMKNASLERLNSFSDYARVVAYLTGCSNGYCDYEPRVWWDAGLGIMDTGVTCGQHKECGRMIMQRTRL